MHITDWSKGSIFCIQIIQEQVTASYTGRNEELQNIRVLASTSFRMKSISKGVEAINNKNDM